MKNCPKCNSEKIKKTGPFAREIKNGEQSPALSEQVVNFHCEDCSNEWQLKFDEDND